jgi:dTDP-4-dehydrorhamnose reductase
LIPELKSLSGKTILITGAKGMLGRGFVENLAKVPGCRALAYGHDELDVTDRAAVLAKEAEKPDFIVHCAALVNADRCQEFPDECHRQQVEGTLNVVELASRSGAKFFYPQSFLIFDGGETPILETTKPNPLSVYGRCKLEAEEGVQARLPESLIVRMAGFFGGEDKDKNFVGRFVVNLHKMIKEGVSSYEVGDRVWQPTYTLDLAYNSLVLLANGKSGIYNMSCAGQASFYELAEACVEELGLAERFKIIPVSADKVAAQTDKAKRPPAAFMENRRLQVEGLDRQRHWRVALAEYLSRPWFQNLFADVR